MQSCDGMRKDEDEAEADDEVAPLLSEGGG
jgi:hypothetical protein